ncbi:MAG: transcription initiation factor IIB [Candidatus Bathyarchaeota archaeon]|nr:transcription initiation factor IIB [Candidatus Bathyarchaeota archaeon]
MKPKKSHRSMPALQILQQKCPECEGTNIVYDNEAGENICGNCGLVIQDTIMDEGPEWRAFTREEKDSRSRVGMPSLYSVHDKGLSTTIRDINRDAFGRKLPLSTRIQMARLKRWHTRTRVHSSIDRNLSLAMTELDRLSDKLSIPASVKEKAALIYRKALDAGLVRGRSIASIASGSLYAACRMTNTPRNLRDVVKASLVSRKDVARSYRLIVNELNVRAPIPDPLIYLSKISRRANVSGAVQAEAIRILKEAKRKKFLAGKDPLGLAAAALYIASKRSGKKRTQKQFAEAAGVTEVTVRNRYRTLRKQLEFD